MVYEALEGAHSVFCGNVASFALFGEKAEAVGTKVQFLDDKAMQWVEEMDDTEAVKANVVSELMSLVDQMSFPSFVNGSFLDQSNYFSTNEEDTHGVNLERARLFLGKLERVGGQPVSERLARAWSVLIRNALDSVNGKSAENLRVWLLCFQNPHMRRPESYHVVIERLLVSFIGLSQSSPVLRWMAKLPLSEFEHIVSTVQDYLKWIFLRSDQSKGVNAAVALGRLHELRKDFADELFYNDVVSEHIDLLRETQLFHDSSRVFSYLRYPFILNPSAKSKIVSISFKLEMERLFRIQALKHQLPLTLVNVRRETLFEDTLTALHNLSIEELRRPMRVNFVGEGALDEGGPRKELFFLLAQTMLNPDYSMFTFDRAADAHWINGSSLVSGVQFELIGTVLGLAIANSVLLTLKFPLVFYDKLLHGETTGKKLEQLGEIDPVLQKSLKDLLSYEGDLSDLGLYFSVTRDHYGETQTVNLIEDGDSVVVDASNVKKYIEKLCDYRLNQSIKTQFESLRKGFRKVVGENKAFNLLNAKELKLLVEGQGEVPIDLTDLRHNAQYIDYKADDVTIEHFWKTVASFDNMLAKKFLLFVTGCAG